MLGLLTLSKCLRFGVMAMVLVALLSITPCSARPAIEADDSADGKIVNQSANINQPRSSILDNIFNIPIQTLKAVNDLVQSIAGNLQQAGSGSYFRARSGSNVRNINVNVDGEEEEAVAELAKAKKNEIKN
ncbi:AGAP006151-PA-like protein [Anopheles sinensis]|uniref:AGAP006151-PA-like protein n=1 Tax=Anopheles sinensis TaxID=74873 RepID=A0A084WEM4_ANOSI|nr:AGAP006151-PA-like protein [Anopheles sinensis]